MALRTRDPSVRRPPAFNAQPVHPESIPTDRPGQPRRPARPRWPHPNGARAGGVSPRPERPRVSPEKGSPASHHFGHQRFEEDSMTFPRRAGLPALALLTLAAALAPGRAPAQTTAVASKPQSPNGKIVFQSTQGGDGFTNDIYVMDADGKHQTRLTDSTNDDKAPVWSPQGDKIAFASDRRGAYEIFLMNADGSNQRPLRSDSPVVGFNFVWSPDGTRLAYPSGGNVYVVEVVAPGGGDSTAAPSNISSAKPAGSLDIEPSWAPGGGRLVIRNATDCPGCSDLYTLNADGTGRTQVTATIGAEANPRWSPVGQQIAYEAFRDGGRHLYVVNADGSGDVKVSGGLGTFGTAGWSPDG